MLSKKRTVEMLKVAVDLCEICKLDAEKKQYMLACAQEYQSQQKWKLAEDMFIPYKQDFFLNYVLLIMESCLYRFDPEKSQQGFLTDNGNTTQHQFPKLLIGSESIQKLITEFSNLLMTKLMLDITKAEICADLLKNLQKLKNQYPLQTTLQEQIQIATVLLSLHFDGTIANGLVALCSVIDFATKNEFTNNQRLDKSKFLWKVFWGISNERDESSISQFQKDFETLMKIHENDLDTRNILQYIQVNLMGFWYWNELIEIKAKNKLELITETFLSHAKQWILSSEVAEYITNIRKRDSTVEELRTIEMNEKLQISKSKHIHPQNLTKKTSLESLLTILNTKLAEKILLNRISFVDPFLFSSFIVKNFYGTLPDLQNYINSNYIEWCSQYLSEEETKRMLSINK